MGKSLLECVPNFSEGRRPEVIEAIVEAFRNRPGCTLFDYRADPDHNRLVVSLVGEPEPVEKALLESAETAVRHIDMNSHEGAHPRVGAIDVIPFTPVQGMTMEECVRFARDFGQRYHERTGIPVYFTRMRRYGPTELAWKSSAGGSTRLSRKKFQNPNGGRILENRHFTRQRERR
jgi:Glutamate formiminotransferase